MFVSRVDHASNDFALELARESRNIFNILAQRPTFAFQLLCNTRDRTLKNSRDYSQLWIRAYLVLNIFYGKQDRRHEGDWYR